MSESEILLIQAIIGALTVLFSVVGAAFAAGSRLGGIEATIHTISERLARIEALFELRLRDDTDDPDQRRHKRRWPT